MVAVNKTVVYCSEQKNVTHARRHTFHETAALTLRCFQKDAESDVTHGGGARPLAVCVACARERSSLSSFRAQARRCAKKKKKTTNVRTISRFDELCWCSCFAVFLGAVLRERRLRRNFMIDWIFECKKSVT